ncbi:MAG: hypothetical protein H6868_01720 [Rhodospirillales bacterium]|nr:hypothetical protein [Rhodospirillales bacterium]
MGRTFQLGSKTNGQPGIAAMLDDQNRIHDLRDGPHAISGNNAIKIEAAAVSPNVDAFQKAAIGQVAIAGQDSANGATYTPPTAKLDTFDV